MPFIWDYDINQLKKSKSGQLLLLERMVNFGPSKGERIPLQKVKKNWSKLNLDPLKKRLMKLLIWGK